MFRCLLSSVGLLAVCGSALASPNALGRPEPAAATIVRAAPVAKPVMEYWPVTRNAELQSLLYDWAIRAGWTLIWESEYSYHLQADARFSGDFGSAVGQLFAALGTVTPPLYVEMYEGNQVLVIKNQPRQ